LAELAVDGLAGDVGAGVTRVAFDQLDGLAEHAAGGVDVVDGQTGARDLRRAEESKVTGLG